MDIKASSGYYVTNKFALIALVALQEILGKDEFEAILTLSNLSYFIDNFPTDNFDKEFDFLNISAINQALEEKYGWRGGHGLSIRAGREIFDSGIKNYGALAGAKDQEFRRLPLPARLNLGLQTMASIISQLSDQQVRIEEYQDSFVYSIEDCPDCLGRLGVDKPVCFLEVGLLQEGLKWMSGGQEFRVNESKCFAIGDDVCEFVIQKSPLG